jgi:hypothetical protein
LLVVMISLPVSKQYSVSNSVKINDPDGVFLSLPFLK